MYAKYVTSMIKGKTYPLDSYTGECVFFLRATLQKEHWRLNYACCQSNTVTDRLANYSTELKLKH
jgi:hypothetical protein